MPKAPTEIRSYARSFSESAIRTLANIMAARKSSDQSKIAAAIALLDRGHGKPTQTLGGDAENPLIHEIRRIIVDPKKTGNTDS